MKIVYSCGHEAPIAFDRGTTREKKQWLIKRAEESGLCPDCRRKDREAKRRKAYIEAKKIAEEKGYLELIGTPKQVEWAETIRRTKLREAYDGLERGKNKEAWNNLITRLISQTEATWWIENRNISPADIGRRWLKEEQNKIPEEVKKEETTYPEEQKTATVAEIRKTAEAVEVNSDKDQLVIDTVKACGFRWRDRVWKMNIDPLNDSPKDRMAEVGNRLLAAGVPILIYDKDVREKAIKGDFEPRHFRWIFANEDPERVYIKWPRSEDYYREARAIPSSKWVSGVGVAVKAAQYDKIKDFAESYGFAITTGAAKLMEKAKEKEACASRVIPATVERKLEKENKLQDILKSSRDVLDDLKDD